MRIVMIGSGYVGLVSGACLSEFGHEVVCVDKDTDKIAGLKRGVMPIYEPGLEEVVATNVKAGRMPLQLELRDSAGALLQRLCGADFQSAADL
jgi:UDPglucose 6-dehydrogenase